MTEYFANPVRGKGLPGLPMPSDDARQVGDLLARCPHHAPTPVIALDGLAAEQGWASLRAKDERARMGLGSFKALGAAYVIAREAQEAGSLEGRVFVCASAGNHGLSVAAGAQAFGARAVIYLAHTVPEPFARRLREMGAEVRREGAEYEASMAAAERAARDEGFTLLSDSSWEGYTDLPYLVMEGYGQLAVEFCAGPAPSHLFLQAGVGGMAASVAAHARAIWGQGVQIIVVEPEAAPALIRSAQAGGLVATEGPVSAMGRLDCKTPSVIALGGLSRDADGFMTITEDQGHAVVARLEGHGIATTPSGAAGLAGAMAMELPEGANVAVILSEGSDGL